MKFGLRIVVFFKTDKCSRSRRLAVVPLWKVLKTHLPLQASLPFFVISTGATKRLKSRFQSPPKIQTPNTLCNSIAIDDLRDPLAGPLILVAVGSISSLGAFKTTFLHLLKWEPCLPRHAGAAEAASPRAHLTRWSTLLLPSSATSRFRYPPISGINSSNSLSISSGSLIAFVKLARLSVRQSLSLYNKTLPVYYCAPKICNKVSVICGIGIITDEVEP